MNSMILENIDISITLPRVLWDELQDYAQAEQEDETQLLIRAIEQFLRHDTTEPDTPKVSLNSNQENDYESLQQIIADIRALPPNLKTLHPPTKSVEQLLTELAENPSPPSEITPEEWDREWAVFEAQQKAIDLTKDRAEGRL